MNWLWMEVTIGEFRLSLRVEVNQKFFLGHISVSTVAAISYPEKQNLLFWINTVLVYLCSPT